MVDLPTTEIIEPKKGPAGPFSDIGTVILILSPLACLLHLGS